VPSAGAQVGKEGTPLTLTRVRGAQEPEPPADALEFVRFCYRRRRLGWPELYDEMVAVAGRRLFQGWGLPELAEVGIGFSLFEIPRLAALVSRVTLEESGPCSTGGPEGMEASRHHGLRGASARLAGSFPGRARLTRRSSRSAGAE